LRAYRGKHPNLPEASYLLKKRETESTLSKFISIQRKIFGVGPDRPNFIFMRKNSKIIKTVLTFGSAFLLFMVFMVVFRII
jgi:hypothetical protein